MSSAPLPRIGAEYPLGFGIQSALGTPATITQWVNQTANTLNPTTGEHMIDTAMGTRATEQESAQGETKVEGGFECDLRTGTIRGLIEALLGGTPVIATGVETIPVGRPSLLTIYDAWGGEAHQYQDCVLGQAVISCSNHLEWHCAFTVLGGLETLVATVTPAVPSTVGDPTLAWADVTGLTGLSATAGQVSQWSFTINNNPKQDFGAGQHAATSTIGGKLQIDGSCMVRYDDANAAAVHAAYKAGTDLGPTALTITNGANVHTITFPNITLLTCVPQKPLDDYQRLSVTFGVKHAEQFTWALPAAA